MAKRVKSHDDGTLSLSEIMLRMSRSKRDWEGRVIKVKVKDAKGLEQEFELVEILIDDDKGVRYNCRDRSQPVDSEERIVTITPPRWMKR